VKQLCDRMSAEVRVESQEGSGSRFTVSLLAAGPLEATA
jgi:signal transduction histidine kinase